MSAENVDAIFEAKIDGAAFSNQADITISIQYQLTSQALLNLIQRGQARYAVQVTCSSTFKRELYLLHEQDFLTLPAGEYSKELTITPYIIATADIAGFIAEQYAGEIRAIREGKTEDFDLRTGTILTLGDPTHIPLDEMQDSLDSVIALVSNPQTRAGSFQIDLEGNRLEIHVNPEDKKKIETFRQQAPNSAEQTSLYLALHLHAVAEALRNLSDYPNTNWAKTMRIALERRKINVEDEELKSASLRYAQELMDRPMERMLTAFINRYEQKYPVLRLTQDAYNTLRQESENNPELYQDPQADFHEVLRKYGTPPYFEETGVFAKRPIRLTPVTTNPRNRADAQALDFYNSLVGMTPSLAIDGRIWAWMTHFKLHSYCIERWPLRWNTDLTKHIRHHWFVENTGSALWQSNAASRTWWIAHTALKAARESGGAFTAEQALEDFANDPEHYHTLMEYNFTRHPLVLAELIRTLLNEAQGLNRDGVRQLGRRLNLTGGTRLLDAIPREQLRAHIVQHVEEIMSDADLVSDSVKLRKGSSKYG